MKKLILSIAITIFSLTAYAQHDHGKTDNHKKEEHKHGEDDKHGEDKHGDHKHEMSEVTTEKNAATSAIIDAYLQIKNGLVADDKSAAAAGGTALLTAFSKFDMSKLKGDKHKEYMEIYEDAKEQAEHIVKSPIDHQREHFETLSTDIHDMVMLLGTEKTLYEDFCPMANGGKGATWLSETSAVSNPFYGAKMKTCGKMQKKIN